MSVLGHEPVEEWPSAIATLVHVVTGHKELWREDWHLLAVFKFKSHLRDLGEGNSVAGTAVTLVSMLTSEIDSLDISPVEVLGKLAVWDSAGVLVLLLVLSSLRICLGEVLGLLEDLVLLIKVLLGLNLSQVEGLVLAVGAIAWMVLLKLASISFPSKIHVVDSLNHQIVLVRCNMGVMGVVSLVGGFAENLLVQSILELNILLISWGGNI
jgi:hypothetical protein